MAKFKRFIFWTSLPILSVVVIVTTLFLEIFELLEKGCHAWEGWLLGYRGSGYTREGGGLWVKSGKK